MVFTALSRRCGGEEDVSLGMARDTIDENSRRRRGYVLTDLKRLRKIVAPSQVNSFGEVRGPKSILRDEKLGVIYILAVNTAHVADASLHPDVKPRTHGATDVKNASG
jgi:hypothetical protein